MTPTDESADRAAAPAGGAAEPPNPIDDVLWPLLRGWAVITAGRLGVFRTLESGRHTLPELAQAVSCPEHGLGELLPVLTANGYLTEQDGHYANGAPARTWLTSTGTVDFTPALLWGEGFAQVAADLPEAVRLGAPATPVWERMAAEPRIGAEFSAFMRAKSLLTVDEIVDRVPFVPGPDPAMLDLGGSHGLHTTAFCRRYPELRSTILDLPAALSGTAAAVEENGVADRVRIREGDYLRDDLGEGYDLVLCFEILHVHSASDCARLLDKAAAALRPGGRIVILEEVRETPNTAHNAAFSLAMFACTGARTYTFTAMRDWLRERGMPDAERIDLAGGSTSVVTAVKK
ncbi:class I SAM-dependent methyltransferase [Streptomonospora sediminis]